MHKPQTLIECHEDNKTCKELSAFKWQTGCSSLDAKINVRFAPTLSLQLQIIHLMKLALIQNRPADLEIAPPLIETPFTDLMLHPEKLEAALKAAKIENDAFEASRKFGRSTDDRDTSKMSSKKDGANRASNHSRPEFKQREFYVEAPSATSVKLAADFTGWGKFPVDMIKSEDGVWFISVPLSPGNYSYRFIVDGEWYDDPHSDLYELNPFGTANAVARVT
jgi:hypothetical protein